MDTPIINPIWFYLINVIDKLSIIAGILVFVLIVAVILLFVVCITEEEDLKLTSTFNKEKHESKVRASFKILKTFVISFIISSLVLVLIPSQDTMMKMLIAQNITYEKIDNDKKTMEETMDYLFQKFNEIKKEEQ